MALVGELLVLLGVNGTPLTAGLSKAEGEIKGFGATGGGALTAVHVAGAAMAAGVGLYLGEAAHAAIGFRDKLVNVGVTAHLTAAEAAAVGTAVQASAIGTTASGTEMLAALGPVAGELQRVAGGHLDAKTAVETLRAAEELSVSSNSDLTTSMKSITDIMLTYHLKASDAAGVSTLLYSAHSQLGVGVDTLGAQLQKLQPRVAGSGVDLKTMLGIAREMEPTVGTGQRAVMTLGSVLQQFMAPTKAASGVLSDLHVKLTNAHGKFIGFGPAIDILHNKLGHLTPAQRAADLHALFGKNVAIATVLIHGGAKALDANKAALDKQGSAADAAATRSADLAHQGEIARKSIETMTEAVGGGLLPVLNRVMSAILPVVTSITAWVQAHPELVTQILLVVGAVGALAAGGLVLGPILGTIGAIVGVIASPIILVVGAIAALAAYFGLLGDGAKGAFDGIAGTVAAAIPGIISAAEQIGSQLMAAIGNALPGILATLSQIGSQVLDWIVGQAPAWAAQLTVWANTFVEWISPIIGQALGSLGQMAGQVVDWINSQAPGWAAQLGTWAGVFVDWITPIAGQALGMLGQLAGQLLAWVSAQVPGWMAQLTKWAAAFVAWVGPMIPPLLAALGQMVSAVAGKVGDLGRAFIAWIGPMAGPVLAALGQFAGQILGWIQRQVPGWMAQLGKWAGAFVGWIAPMIQPAMIALGGLMSAGLQWVSAQLPKWGIALLKWATAFIGWILPMIPPLLLALAGVGLAIIGWVIQQVPVLAGAVLGLGRAIVDWIDASMPAMRAALGRFINDMIKWFGEVIPKIQKAAVDFGTTIVNGILAGIGDIGKTVGDKLNTIPGLSLIGGAVGGAVGAAQGVKLPGFATGGVVPGTGPQLAIVHGGETVTPAGKGGGQTNLTHTTVVQLDGQTIGQVVERLLFNSASGFSSGFAGSSVTD